MYFFMKNKVIVLLFLITISFYSNAQLPTPAIVGYWESWNGSKFVDLKDVDDRYNVIHVSFAEETNGKDYIQSYTPPNSYTEAEFKSEMAALQAQGKKVIISIGGQNGHVMLDSIAERDGFISSINDMIDYWNFDGLDIDLEGSSLNFTGINIQSPGDVRQLYLIDGIKKIMENYHAKHGKKMLLTMAPETIYIQGALSPWAGAYRGAYLPLIESLKDSIDMLNVQLYNSGTMYGLDGQSGGEFVQGTADFVVAMTEAVIKGFTATGTIGTYTGIDESKVGVALPGCHSSDAVPHKELQQAMAYLMGDGPKPGKYELKTAGGFPNLKGMMTWSINSDRSCDPSYGFVDTYSKIFTDSSYIEINNNGDIYEQNESGKIIEINLFKDTFSLQLDTSKWTVENLPSGVYIDTVLRVSDSIAHLVLGGNSTAEYPSAIWNVKVTADASQFKKSTLNLDRGTGVIFKKKRTKIPGVLQCENFSAFKSAYTANLFNGEAGLMLRFNKAYSADFEIDVDSTADYEVDFRIAIAPGSHATVLKVDGGINSSQNMSSTTSWKTWEIKTFTTKLDSGHHVLTIYMSSGWANIDWLEFREATTNSSVKLSVAKKTTLYPNPSTGIFNSSQLLNNVRVYSFEGQLLQQWNSSTQFDLSHFSSGSYLLIADGFKTIVVVK